MAHDTFKLQNRRIETTCFALYVASLLSKKSLPNCTTQQHVTEAKRKSHATTQRKRIRSSDGDKDRKFLCQEAAKGKRKIFNVIWKAFHPSTTDR